MSENISPLLFYPHICLAGHQYRIAQYDIKDLECQIVFAGVILLHVVCYA